MFGTSRCFINAIFAYFECMYFSDVILLKIFISCVMALLLVIMENETNKNNTDLTALCLSLRLPAK